MWLLRRLEIWRSQFIGKCYFEKRELIRDGLSEIGKCERKRACGVENRKKLMDFTRIWKYVEMKEEVEIVTRLQSNKIIVSG